MYVSDDKDYISGELFQTDDGYRLALMMSLRESTAYAEFSVLQGGLEFHKTMVGPDEPAILQIKSPSRQRVKAVVYNRGELVSSHVYRLTDIPGVSEGLALSDRTADESLYPSA